jgi:uncharacterized LabA/DUF88 family protein
MDRVCIFIDGSNFYHALKGADLPVKIDFGKLGEKLTGKGRRHIHTYYYNAGLIAPRPDDPEFAEKDKRCRGQQSFFNALRFVPNLTFRAGSLQQTPGRPAVEKGVDVMIAVDMLVLAYKDRYDVAVLVSSDSDYKSVIEAVKFETGKVVELRQVEGSRAFALITAASIYEPITPSVIRACQHRPAGKPHTPPVPRTQSRP